MVDILGFHIGRNERHDDAVSVEESGAVDNASYVEVEQTAAVVFGLYLYSRGFAAATLDPPIMSPDQLAGVARDLILHGQWVALIGTEAFDAALHRASSAVIRGGYRRTTWRYDLTLPAPSEPSPPVYGVPWSGVCHVMMQSERSSPWRGRSPLLDAGVSSDLLAAIEDGLAREEDWVRVHVLSHGPDVQRKDQLRKDLAEGGLRLMEQGNTSWQAAQRGNSTPLQSIRIGPAPDASEITLRAQVSQDVLSAMGVPSGLYAAREGSVSREAYRQWHASGLEPMGEALRAELERKLERPIRINFHRLAAADINARARGLKSLIDAKVEPESAALAVGMSGLQFMPPPPSPPPLVQTLPGAPPQPPALPPGREP